MSYMQLNGAYKDKNIGYVYCPSEQRNFSRYNYEFYWARRHRHPIDEGEISLGEGFDTLFDIK
jgi:hypothetical protein